MSDTRVTIRLPADFYEAVRAEADRRRTSLTTILWERLGLFDQAFDHSDLAAETALLIEDSPRGLVLDQAWDHRHKWGPRGPSGFRKCACGETTK